MPGASGSASWIDGKETVTVLPSKCSVHLQKGDRIRIETPGGGGWGEMENSKDDG
jgi:N-methylhydantoinase B/oxoprolinase/acetone carboxylase alpha subunit